MEKRTFIFLWKHWNLTKNFDDVSTFEKIRNFDYISGFAAQNLIV